MAIILETSIKVPHTWANLLAASDIPHSPILSNHTRLQLDDTRKFQFDHRVIPIVLGGYYSAELILYSDELSYHCKMHLIFSQKVVDESTIWSKLGRITLKDWGNEFAIDMKWCQF